MGCHTPHGSQNARLLNMPNINVLVQPVPQPGCKRHGSRDGCGIVELTPCTDCHTYIHGSNMNAAFLR
jgi:hypothetical protein